MNENREPSSAKSQLDSTVEAIKWDGASLQLLDQRLLPEQEVYVRCVDGARVAEAIRTMVVRGAPAIGIAAAYGIAMAARQQQGRPQRENTPAAIQEVMDLLAAARPTAVNLFWAIERMRRRLLASQSGERGERGESVESVEKADADALAAEAVAIHQQDIAANRRMAQLGSRLIKESEYGSVLTHCNAGSLATGGIGTALGVIRAAYADGLIDQVYADETRPWWQGSRLTAWELSRDHIPVVLIADGAAGHVMKTQAIGWVVVGADRIAANGDVANKIGTYGLAVLARHHGAKLMVVAPTSTVDFATACGEDIVIEERSPDELKQVYGQQLAPAAAAALNPVFDVTPADLVDAIVTEKGVVQRPDRGSMLALK